MERFRKNAVKVFMNLKYYFLLGLPILFFVSCQNNDLSTIVAPHVTLMPVKLEQGNQTTELKYDASNRVTQMTFRSVYPGGTIVSTQNFKYDSDGLVTELTTEAGMRFEYFYQDKRIVKTDEYIGDHLTQSHQFLYDPQHRVTRSVTYQNIPEEGGIIPVSKSTYAYDANGNVTQNKLYFYSTGGTNETLLTTLDFSGYDNEVNSEMYFELIAINPAHFAFKNNPTKLEIRNQNGVLVSTEYYSYTYNESGYAISKTTVAKSLKGTETYQTSYFFQ